MPQIAFLVFVWFMVELYRHHHRTFNTILWGAIGGTAMAAGTGVDTATVMLRFARRQLILIGSLILLVTGAVLTGRHWIIYVAVALALAYSLIATIVSAGLSGILHVTGSGISSFGKGLAALMPGPMTYPPTWPGWAKAIAWFPMTLINVMYVPFTLPTRAAGGIIRAIGDITNTAADVAGKIARWFAGTSLALLFVTALAMFDQRFNIGIFTNPLAMFALLLIGTVLAVLTVLVGHKDKAHWLTPSLSGGLTIGILVILFLSATNDVFADGVAQILRNSNDKLTRQTQAYSLDGNTGRGIFTQIIRDTRGWKKEEANGKVKFKAVTQVKARTNCFLGEKVETQPYGAIVMVKCLPQQPNDPYFFAAEEENPDWLWFPKPDISETTYPDLASLNAASQPSPTPANAPTPAPGAEPDQAIARNTGTCPGASKLEGETFTLVPDCPNGYTLVLPARTTRKLTLVSNTIEPFPNAGPVFKERVRKAGLTGIGYWASHPNERQEVWDKCLVVPGQLRFGVIVFANGGVLTFADGQSEMTIENHTDNPIQARVVYNGARPTYGNQTGTAVFTWK